MGPGGTPVTIRAPLAARAYRGGGYADWYLPSLDEVYYWSSSERAGYYWWNA